MPDPLIKVVAEIASTNSALLARLANGEAPAEGHWLVADRQTSGRGRAGRVWTGGLGNFMGSTAVALRDSEALPQTLALVAGVSVHRALKAVVPALSGLSLKWPNDLLVGEAKLGGILLERQRDAVIVGIGVNLSEAPEVAGRKTVSLAALGFAVSRDVFASALAETWAEDLTTWHAGGWLMLRAEWLARALPKGTLLGVNLTEEGHVIGSFAGLEPDGAVLLRLADGSVRAIHAGDVELIGASGESHASGG
ncbi:biotin--[acetyl-CoA-carboxylase] ligase [Novosphingobium sp.]|uniref:biotin--[acetyl-CoA-carboxylase] ligase n=1 Tax=Novosphingobium sp. TaxID=1874826 RepID=UPI003BACB364